MIIYVLVYSVNTRALTNVNFGTEAGLQSIKYKCRVFAEIKSQKEPMTVGSDKKR